MADKAKTTQERQSKQTLAKKLQAKRKANAFHSARFLSERSKIDGLGNVALPLAEAIEKINETSSTKFNRFMHFFFALSAIRYPTNSYTIKI